MKSNTFKQDQWWFTLALCWLSFKSEHFPNGSHSLLHFRRLQTFCWTDSYKIDFGEIQPGELNRGLIISIKSTETAGPVRELFPPAEYECVAAVNQAKSVSRTCSGIRIATLTCELRNNRILMRFWRQVKRETVRKVLNHLDIDDSSQTFFSRSRWEAAIFRGSSNDQIFHWEK